MKYKISVEFKKIAQQVVEKHNPNYSGQFPVKSDALDADYVRDFKNAHQKLLKNDFQSPEDFVSRIGKFGYEGGHYIIRGDGSMGELAKSHVTHMSDATTKAGDRTEKIKRTWFNKKRKPTPEELELPTRYTNNYRTHETYELIHHLFEGGIRLYVTPSKIVITAYQVPSDRQLDMIEKISEIDFIDNIYSYIVLQKNNEIVKYTTNSKNFEDFKNFIMKLRDSNQAASQEAINRIQLLQSFRGDSDPNATEIMRLTKPKPASELGRKLTREEIQAILEKYPPLRNMEKSARNRAIIRIAERLDENNCYQQSDWVMEMVDEV